MRSEYVYPMKCVGCGMTVMIDTTRNNARVRVTEAIKDHGAIKESIWLGGVLCISCDMSVHSGTRPWQSPRIIKL